MIKKAENGADLARKNAKREKSVQSGAAKLKESGQTTFGIKEVRAGVLFKYFKVLAKQLEMDDRELAKALKISGRTFDRRLRAGVLSPAESDRLSRLSIIFKRAEEVFGNAEKAREWIETPLEVFEGETALERADTSLGAAQVDDVLGRIQYGVYS
jgi:putative toxin-antitoxin system antitoxin component (TIGR02293 family)